MSTTTSKAKVAPVIRTIKVSASRRSDQSHTNPSNSARSAQPRSHAAGDNVPFEDVLNRGLDLAETGIGLGVNIVARLGSMLKDQVVDRFSGAELFGTTPNTQQQTAQTRSTSEPQQAPSEQAYYLINRLPAHPGGDVALSFSINNDSLTAPKEIRISIEDFVDEGQHPAMRAELFQVTPPNGTIAPADFEKFVLQTTLPAEIAPGTYYGWLTVSEQQTYRIPVVLVITSQQGGEL